MSEKRPLGYVETQYEIEYTARSKLVDIDKGNVDKSPIEVTIRAELILQDHEPFLPRIYRSDRKFLFHNIDDMLSNTTESWYAHNQILALCKEMKTEILKEIFKR